MRRGIRWRIGNGTNVDIWKDKWIPQCTRLKPITPNLFGLEETSVSILIDVEFMSWDVAVVQNLFWEDDSDLILQIPLSSSCTTDTRIWSLTNHGVYSVKTAYYLAREMKVREMRDKVGQTSSHCHINWSWIWKLHIPNRRAL